jgi:hypothetical protein
MGGYTRAVSGQRLGKHVPAATDKRNNRRAVFSMWSLPRCCKHGAGLELSQLKVSSVRESVKRGLEGVKLKNLHC